MNPDLEKILALQSADREIARLTQEIAALPKKVAVIEEKLAKSKAQVERARGALKAGEGARRKYEGEIQSLQQKISKYREQSLDVKTNDQYKALLHEISFAEKSIRDFEDKILETMVDAESQEKVARAAEQELKAETAEIEKEKAEVRARTAQDEKELNEWRTRRSELRSGINPDVLNQYDRVLKLRGSGVAEVREQKCLACHVMLRPQTYNEVRTNEQVIQCDSCGRILIYAGEPVTATAPETPTQAAAS
jgi:predicted  nucleic acid-binding Zn-ribbon protein